MRDAFFEELVNQAKKNSNIMILTADHGAFALESFAKNYPNQYINMGIAEQNMVGVAAGLAASGKTVFIYGITPFVSLRVLEHLSMDVALMQLPVHVISVGSGFTYSTDGPSHQGLQDINAISSIPGIKILNCSDPENSKFFVSFVIKSKTPHYIRIEKEKLAILDRLEPIHEAIDAGFSTLSTAQSDLLIITTGYQSHRVLSVVEKIKESNSLNLNLVDLHQLKPLTQDFKNYLSRFSKFIVIEESFPSLLGIIKNAINNSATEFTSIAVDEIHNNIFLGSSREEILELNGLSLNAIEEVIRQKI